MSQIGQTNQEWQTAIQTAYDVFARYPCPHRLEASPVKDPVQILRDLVSAPLANLPENKLTAFAAAALYTVGSEEDYKHFLPRILQLMIPEPGGFGLDPELTAEKLQYARFDSWPANEVSAIRDVFKALPFVPDNDSFGPSFASTVLSTLLIGNAPETLLSRLAAPRNGDGVRRLAELVRDTANFDDDRGWLARRLSKEEKTVVRSWAQSEAVTNALINGVDQVSDEDVWEVESALMTLGRL